MPENKKDADTSRRDFLKLAAVAAPTAAATAVVGTQAAAQEAPINHGGLQMTDHVKKYLESARF